MANLTLSEWLARDENDRRLRENATSIKRIPASEGSFAPYPHWINPLLQPIVNRELCIRQSALTPARNMMNDLIENKIQTIAFTTSRLNVEVLEKGYMH